MFRQNEIGVKLIIIIAIKPMQKRIICGSAHLLKLPPATENSIRKPIQLTAANKSAIGQ